MALPWLLAGTSAFVASPARAQLELDWNAPPECPSPASIVSRVRAHLPEDLWPGPNLHARAHVEAVAGGYRLALRLESGETTASRSLSNRSCDALADAVALLVALAIEAPPESRTSIDPARFESKRASSSTPARPESSSAASRSQAGGADGDGERSRQAGGTEASRAPPPTAAEVPVSGVSGVSGDGRASHSSPSSRPAHSARGEAHALQLGLAAGVRLDLGMLPHYPSWGLQPRVLGRVARLHAALGVTFWFPAQARSETYPPASLVGRGIVGDAALGFELLSSPVTLAPFVAFEFGRVVVESRGISEPARSPTSWLAAGGGVRAAIRIAPNWELELELSLMAPFERPRWLVRAPAADVDVFTSSSLVARTSLALAFVFE